jgi:hypothetical protein
MTGIVGLAARLDEAAAPTPLTLSAQALLEIAIEMLGDMCSSPDCGNTAHLRYRLVIAKAQRPA